MLIGIIANFSICTTVVFGEETQLQHHQAISFVGNNGFTTYNGVVNPTANGTEEDPFIIEGWTITAEEKYDIFIAETDAFFVIRNVLVGSGDCGICFLNVQNGLIENVTINGCNCGLQWLYVSGSCALSSGFYNCTEYGIYMANSYGNKISHNIIVDNTEGINLIDCANNTIFDNLFRNHQCDATDFGLNNWNITMQPGRNIIGGMCLGGNYFHSYVGEDSNSDGIGDISYDIRWGMSKDELPLFNLPPKASFFLNPSNATVGEIVEFFDLSVDPESRLSEWLWTFGDGINSTCRNPFHKYTTSGQYPVCLTVTDFLNKTDMYYTTIYVSPAQILFSMYISEVDIQPQVRKMRASFSVGWVTEPKGLLWLTVKDGNQSISFLLLEQSEISIPITTGGSFPDDFLEVEFYVSLSMNYTVQFSPILSNPLEKEYEVKRGIFEAFSTSPSTRLESIPNLYHFHVKTEIARPLWFSTRWNILTWLPIVIIAILITVSNLLIPPKDKLRDHLTIYLSIVFFSLGFVSSILQYLPPTILLVEILLPLEVIFATLMLAVNMWASRKQIDKPIFCHVLGFVKKHKQKEGN